MLVGFDRGLLLRPRGEMTQFGRRGGALVFCCVRFGGGICLSSSGGGRGECRLARYVSPQEEGGEETGRGD